jgi:xeroderma pigmentosum group C-complementing protein
MSLAPLSLQSAFLSIKKSLIPDAGYRGHTFENSVKALVEWWSDVFFRVQKTGHIESHTFEEIQQLLKLDEYEFDDDYQLAYASLDGHEIIKSSKSLMKHALMRSGSRDVSAQLFTALCRALDIPARLVVSLQSVPWQANGGKSKPNGKKRSRTDTPADPDSDMEEIAVPPVRDNKGKGRATELDGGYVVSDGSRSSTTGSPSVDGKGKGKGRQKPTPAVRLRKSRSKPPPRKSLEGKARLHRPHFRLTHSQMILT